jgi:serine protease Do
VITYKLNAMKMVAAGGDLPQNVNFALKASVVANFLDKERVSYDTGSATTPMQPADLAGHAKTMSVFIACRY